MSSLNKLTISEVMACLAELGIAYEFVGPVRNVTKACSLLHKERGGLYYYSGSDEKLIETLQDSVLICHRSIAVATVSCSCIAVDGDPQVVFYRLCSVLFSTRLKPGIHPTAIVHPDAEIAADAQVGPYSIIGRARVGTGSVVHAHVVIMDGCTIGERVMIEPHCCIGATGAVWVWGETNERLVLPQVGGVTIGDDVFLGADVSIVRGLLNENTTVGKGCMIAPGPKLGHSVVLEADVHLANNVSIAGSAVIGARSFLGSGCSVRSHTRLAHDTIVGLGSAVVRDVLEPGLTIAGVPASAMKAKAQRQGVPKLRKSD